MSTTVESDLGRLARKRTRYPRVAVLVPCLNEAAAIEDTIRSVPANEIKGMGYEVEVVVIDNGSEDATARLARRAGARVISEPERGKGRAFRTGLDSVRADFILMIDGDNTYPAGLMPLMLRMLGEHDFVIGSRLRGRATKQAMSGVNRVGNRILSLAASALCGRRTTDVCTGLWGFKADVVKSLGLKARGFELEMELFCKLAKGKYSFCEVPVPYIPRRSPSKLKILKDGAKIGWTLLKVRYEI